MPKKFSFDKEKALENFSRGFEQFTYRNKIKPIEIAKDFGLTHAAVSSWKNGKGFPDFQTLYKLFDMGMTIKEVFGEKFGSVIIGSIKNEVISAYLDDVIEEENKLFELKRRECAEALAQIKFLDDAKDMSAQENAEKKIKANARLNLAKDDILKISDRITMLNGRDFYKLANDAYCRNVKAFFRH